MTMSDEDATRRGGKWLEPPAAVSDHEFVREVARRNEFVTLRLKVERLAADLSKIEKLLEELKDALRGEDVLHD
jgi:hypothetical protein